MIRQKNSTTKIAKMDLSHFMDNPSSDEFISPQHKINDILFVGNDDNKIIASHKNQ
jgi:hypothetical protein